MGGLFSMPKPPAPPPPPEIPESTDDDAVRRAARRRRAASRTRSGVLSTIRPGAGGSLGQGTILGGAFDRFSNRTLGGS